MQGWWRVASDGPNEGNLKVKRQSLYLGADYERLLKGEERRNNSIVFKQLFMYLTMEYQNIHKRYTHNKFI